MKKEMVSIICLLVLIFGVSLIFVILNPYETENTDDYHEINTFSGDYRVVSEITGFTEYEFKDLVLLDLYIDNFNILYKNSTLKINDKVIKEKVYLHKRAALYENSKLILFIKYKDKPHGAYVIFNTLDDTYEVHDTLDKMYVMVNDNIYFEYAGVSFNTTLVSDKIFIKDNKSICDTNRNDVIMRFNELIFDHNSLKFEDFEVISSTKLEPYKIKNELCQ